MALLVLLAAFVAFSSLADRSRVGSLDLVSETGSVITRLTVVNDAGPVRISRFERQSLDDPLFDENGVISDGPQVLHVDSFLVSGPSVESDVDGSEMVVRVRCETRMPCRSRIEVVVPDGIAVLVVAPNGPVQVDGFVGELSIFSGDGGVVLGPVDGSARVVTQGDVIGSGLDADDIEVASIAGVVDLEFATLPTALTVRGSEEEVLIELPVRRIQIDAQTSAGEPLIDARTTDRGDRKVVVRSDGPISVVNPPSS